MKKLASVSWSMVALLGVLGGACESNENDDGMGGMGGELNGSGGASTTGGKGNATGGKGGSTGGQGMATGGKANSGGTDGSGGKALSGGASNGTGGAEGIGGQVSGGAPSGGMGGASGGAESSGGATMASGGAFMATACEDFPELQSGDMGGAGSMGGASGAFVIASPHFDFCAAIPADHTCDGKPFGSGTLPPLSWTDGPEGTQSYAIVFKDLTILERNTPGSFQYNRGYHWVIWDIPADMLELPEGLPGGHFPPEVSGARQWGVRNNYGYLGSCPNFDPAMSSVSEDTYSFTLYALPDAIIDVPAKGQPNNYTVTMAEYLETIAISKTEIRATSNARATEGPPALDTLVYPCPTEGEPTPDCVERLF